MQNCGSAARAGAEPAAAHGAELTRAAGGAGARPADDVAREREQRAQEADVRWRMLRRHLEQEVLVLDELAGAGHAAHRVDPPAAGPGSGADRQVQALAHRRHDSAVRRRHLLAQRRGQEREDESGAEDHRAGNDLDFRKNF